MTVFAEFHVPASSFALYETLQAKPEVVVEIERVAATEELVTPYFVIDGCEPASFEAVAADDPSVEHLERIDEFRESTLYRAEWVTDIEPLVYAYTAIDATILQASAQHGLWELRMRFPDESSLSSFDERCRDLEVGLEVTRLYEQSTREENGKRKFGLTEKQHEALVMAWELEYFSSPAVTLSDVATELDISPQALSTRLRRGHDRLIEHTIAVTPPGDEE